jgi:hypothetical protein
MRAFVCLLAISLIGAVRAQEPQSNREGVITGRIMAADGQPLSGVSVRAFAVGKLSAAWTSQQTSCDAEGNFKVTGRSPRGTSPPRINRAITASVKMRRCCWSGAA